MQSRRGVSATVAGLIAVVAVLGTTVYFMSGNVSILQNSSESLNQQNSPSNQLENRADSDSEEETTSSSISTQAIKVSNVHSWVTSDAMLKECQSLGIDMNDCNETSILAKKRMTGSTEVTVISVTALAIQNTGSTQLSVNSIALRGLPVAQEHWYSCDPSSCGTSTNINTELTVDYNPSDGVSLASGNTAFTSGQISLRSGEGTIVYLLNAGDIQPVDAGNTYALQIQAGQATAVQQVSVVTA